MTLTEVLERKEAFDKGIAEIDNKLKTLAAEYARLADMKKTTLGAIADCEYWIKKLAESDTSDGGESE